MTEHDFSRKIRTLLAEYSPSTYKWKIKADFADGVPDFFLEGDTQDLWVEVKFIKKLPTRPNTPIDVLKMLSKLQQQWLVRRENRRGDTLVIIGTPKQAALFWRNSWKDPILTSIFINNAVTHRNAVQEIVKKLTVGD